MNRRDAALIAHLDFLHGELMTEIRLLRSDIAQLREDVVGLKVDAHHHDEE